MNDIKMFLLENTTCIVIICSVIFLFIVIVGNILIKKNEKERNEFVYNVLSCSLYDFKHKVNQHEVTTENKQV